MTRHEFRKREIALAESYASEYVDVRDFSTASAENAAWSAVRAGYLKACEDWRDQAAKLGHLPPREEE